MQADVSKISGFPVLPMVFTVAALAAALLWINGGKRFAKTVNRTLASLAAAVTAAAVILCIAAPRLGVVICRPEGDPAQTVQEFFDELFAGNLTASYSKSANISGLGLENPPEDGNNAAVFDALKNSYSCALVGECRTDGLSAQQDVCLTYLDLSRVREAIKAETAVVLEEMTAAASSKDEYLDENSNYLPEFTDTIYEKAVGRVLSHAQDYYSDSTQTVKLVYENGAWLVMVDEQLFNALCGGVV